MSTTFDKDPQVTSNDMSIVFGMLTSVLTIAGVVTTIVQCRRTRGSESYRAEDVELQSHPSLAVRRCETVSTEPTMIRQDNPMSDERSVAGYLEAFLPSANPPDLHRQVEVSHAQRRASIAMSVDMTKDLEVQTPLTTTIKLDGIIASAPDVASEGIERSQENDVATASMESAVPPTGELWRTVSPSNQNPTVHWSLHVMSVDGNEVRVG